jgi:hypothetical protein
MRIRTIKPEFWQHEVISRLSEFSRLLALALLNYSDDEGYFNAHPSLIRGNLFPFQDDSNNILGSLQDLSRVGYISITNSEDGREIGKIINFEKHQRIDKPQKSKIKPLTEDSTNRLGLFVDDSKSRPRGNREQGTGNGTGNGTCGDEIVSKIWEAYPKKVSKPPGIKSIEKALKLIDGQVLLKKVLEFADLWKGEDMQYCPYPATWFNSCRFNDPPETWRNKGNPKAVNPNACTAAGKGW